MTDPTNCTDTDAETDTEPAVPGVPVLASPLPGEDVFDIDGPDQDVDQTPGVDTTEGDLP